LTILLKWLVGWVAVLGFPVDHHSNTVTPTGPRRGCHDARPTPRDFL
jgi:hypothetical protein